MVVGDTCVSWFSHTSTNTTFLSKATDYFSHMPLQRWEGKIRRKEKSPQPRIELTTTSSWVQHADHWASHQGGARKLGKKIGKWRKCWKLTFSTLSTVFFSFQCIIDFTYSNHIYFVICNCFWPFPKQALVFTCLQYKSLENWKKEKLSKMSNFSFSHRVFYLLTLYSIDTHFDALTIDSFWKHCGKRRNCS